MTWNATQTRDRSCRAPWGCGLCASRSAMAAHAFPATRLREVLLLILRLHGRALPGVGQVKAQLRRDQAEPSTAGH